LLEQFCRLPLRLMIQCGVMSRRNRLLFRSPEEFRMNNLYRRARRVISGKQRTTCRDGAEILIVMAREALQQQQHTNRPQVTQRFETLSASELRSTWWAILPEASAGRCVVEGHMKFSGTQPVSQEGISFSSTCRGRSVALL
jgi:hypothetical protein